MNPAIILPYRYEPTRLRPFELVNQHLCAEFPTWPLFVCDQGGEHFNDGWARNNAVRALRETFDVLVFNDADTLVPAHQIEAAAEHAAAQPGLVFAFDYYTRLDEETTRQLAAPLDAFVAPTVWEMAGSGSTGCIAIRRECFEQVGGYDEAYQGWGYEDLDFDNRCASLWPLRKVPGRLVHLWHEPSENRPEQVELQEANRKRYQEAADAGAHFTN